MSQPIPCLQFRSKSIIQYNTFERSGRFPRTEAQKLSAQKLKDQNTYSGKLCPGAKKRLIKAIELLVQKAEQKTHTFISKRTGQERTIKFGINFITVTVYSTDRNIKGKEAHKRCLEPLLLWMHRKYNCTMYIWKAELQKRGQIHYHITSDTFIDHEDLREKWNALQREAGYLDTHFAKYGHWNPNGTDVHSCYKEQDMAGYLRKKIIKGLEIELAKNVQNSDTIGGKVWDCSLNLKKSDYYQLEAYEDQSIIHRAEREAKKPGNEHVITDHCVIYKFRRPSWYILTTKQRADYFNKMAENREYKRNTPIVSAIAPPPAPPPAAAQPPPLIIDSFQALMDYKWLKKNGYVEKVKKKVNFKPGINLFSAS